MKNNTRHNSYQVDLKELLKLERTLSIRLYEVFCMHCEAGVWETTREWFEERSLDALDEEQGEGDLNSRIQSALEEIDQKTKYSAKMEAGDKGSLVFAIKKKSP